MFLHKIQCWFAARRMNALAYTILVQRLQSPYITQKFNDERDAPNIFLLKVAVHRCIDLGMFTALTIPERIKQVLRN